VTGAAGGFALELAALCGLRTVAVAAPQDEHLVRELGATDFVARTDELGKAVRNLIPGGVDAVIDAAVLGISAHNTLRGGHLRCARSALRAARDPRDAVVVAEAFADGARLTELSALVDARHLTLRVGDTFALARWK
jgi:NADPH:quinone reductase